MVARSDAFGQFIKDIIGTDSLRDSERITGLSTSYINSMKNGLIPSPEALAQFADGYGLDDAHKQRLIELAGEGRADVSPETFLQLACIGAGMSVNARLRILEQFRQAVDAEMLEPTAA